MKKLSSWLHHGEEHSVQKLAHEKLGEGKGTRQGTLIEEATALKNIHFKKELVRDWGMRIPGQAPALRKPPNWLHHGKERSL